MDRQCFACSRTIRPADGPALLWGVQASAQGREAFHLDCWLAWRSRQTAEQEPATTSLPERVAA